jgi:hypothetical protein
MDTTEFDPHRPRQLEDMAGVTEWKRFSTIVGRPDPPHVILAGGAGTGKSCVLRLLLGSATTLWLRCSQDPSLRDSRDRIKAAARRRVLDGKINWIVLEHADLLHADAQSFLRRIIETNMGSTRFVLEVRDVAAIAEPLLSRTVLFSGPTLMPYEITAEVRKRAPHVDPHVAIRIGEQSGGNIRWAVLQGLGGGDGMIDTATLQTPDTVTQWADVLRAMEDIQKTGTSPRAWIGDYSTGGAWDRAGGACPWAITAAKLSKRV